jgi:hypothetical protein
MMVTGSLRHNGNNPKLSSSPIEEDVDDSGARIVPGPRSYSDVTKLGEECIIFSSSITQRIKRRNLDETFAGGNVSFRRFPGAKARHIKDYTETTLKESAPKFAIIQSGGNDLPTPRYNPVPVADIANEIIETGLLCRRYGVQHIFISSVLLRRQFYQQQRCRDLNAFLRDLCVVNNFIFIDNANISVEHLFTDGVHLTDQGSQILCDNYLFYLNSTFDDIFST